MHITNDSTKGGHVVPLPLSDEVEAVLQKFLICEFATLGKDGTPIMWPTVPLYLPERGHDGSGFVIHEMT